MCEPYTTANDPVQGAIHELLSAMSALHMEPDSIDNPIGEFLVHMDRWAAHSHAHMQQALVYLRKIRPEDLSSS
jgi:hypothetical protein